jgi:hypothetical protein
MNARIIFLIISLLGTKIILGGATFAEYLSATIIAYITDLGYISV